MLMGSRSCSVGTYVCIRRRATRQEIHVIVYGTIAQWYENKTGHTLSYDKFGRDPIWTYKAYVEAYSPSSEIKLEDRIWGHSVPSLSRNGNTSVLDVLVIIKSCV